MTNAIDTFINIENAAHEGAFGNNPRSTPTDAQAKAGNYKLGRATIYGLPVAIEQPRHSYRTGQDPNGKRWENKMAAHYGYFSGTRGADGDGVDCFIGFFPQSEQVYIINQYVNGKFDEHKVCLCFPDEETAKRAYLDSYDKGWNGLHSIITASIAQFKWWLKNGNMNNQIALNHLPYEGLETMKQRVAWDDAANPIGTALHKVLYEIQRADSGEALIFDSVCMADIMDYADEVMALDAMVTPYAKLERKMQVLKSVMDRHSDAIKVEAVQISDPFKQSGVAQVAVIFELSDGQTVSIFFHNPDVDPKKIQQSDELISWKWLMNKKDITIVVAPEKGDDLNIKAVAERIMKLADKNSAAFVRANSKRAEKMQAIEAIKTEIVTLEQELKDVQHELEVAKMEVESGEGGIDSVDGEIIQGGKFDGFKLVAQSALGVKSPLVNVYGLSDRIIGVVNRDDIDMFKSGNGKALQPIGGWQAEFSNELKEMLGLTGIEPEIDWTKATGLNTDAEVQALGIARIDEIGSENVYIEKDGKPYYMKPASTNGYQVGEYDFSNDWPFGDGADKTAQLNPEIPEDYAKIMASESLKSEYRNELHKTFEKRELMIGRSLSSLGWENAPGGLKVKGEIAVLIKPKVEMAGLVGEYRYGLAIGVYKGEALEETIADDLTKTPEQLASEIDTLATAETAKPEIDLSTATLAEIIAQRESEIKVVNDEYDIAYKAIQKELEAIDSKVTVARNKGEKRDAINERAGDLRRANEEKVREILNRYDPLIKNHPEEKAGKAAIGLENVVSGVFDNMDLSALLDKIDKFAQVLMDAGMAEQYDDLIGKAAEKWAELDQKANG
jgi:hypothetical protein